MSQDGCSMGNSLSPLVAEAFMCQFECDLHDEGLLPRIWLRYVDDTFAVVKKSDVANTLNILNSRHTNIKFTVETKNENNNTLPFLDVLIHQVNNKIEFSIHRKPSTTDRYITNDSFCSYQHKIAAFHSSVYRLCRLPLSVTDFKAEYDRIVNIANTNGFDQTLIDKLVQKHSNNIKKYRLSTLFEQNKALKSEKQQIVSMQYFPEVSNKLTNCFDKNNMKLVFCSSNKLSSALGSTKDPLPIREQSGVYEISCSDCDKKYIGQTRRALHTRVKEHIRSIKNRDIQKAIPAHMFDPDNTHAHKLTSLEENVKLLKPINNSRKLDAYESFYIYKTKNLMNLENGPIDSPLFKLIS